MRIDALTISIDYADCLAVTLPRTLAHADRCLVVTVERDVDTIRVCNECGAECLTVPDEPFCKAHAVNRGLDALGADDWILLLDADIALSDNSRMVMDRYASDPDTIYGAYRYLCEFYPQWEKLTRNWNIRMLPRDQTFQHAQGYFQVFHSSRNRRWPLENVPDLHTGRHFAALWKNQRYMPLHLPHLGHRGLNNQGRVTAPFVREPNYTDEDLTFFFNTYKDAKRANWMLGHLRGHYPEARVVMATDGDDDPAYRRYAEEKNVELVYGEKLYTLRMGGRIIQRMLDLFLRKPTQYLFKIDTDTGFHRRFLALPTRSGMFGRVQISPAGKASVQGGCQGITLDAAQKMAESGLFQSADFRDFSDDSWTVEDLMLLDSSGALTTGMVSTDWLLGYGANKLGIAMYEYPEIYSEWQDYRPNPDLRYAVTHPCKDFHL